MNPNMRLAILIASGSLLAAGTGVLGAMALGTSSSQAPTTTTTITLKDGAQGPTGPSGPAGADGSPGAESCPTGSEFGELIINHPGGHVTLLTCIKNEAP
jgi:hypothetical protein